MESTIDYKVKVSRTFKPNNYIDKLLCSYTKKYLNKEFNIEEYLDNIFSCLDTISRKLVNKQKYLLYNIGLLTSMNPDFLYRKIFLDFDEKTFIDIIILITSRLSIRAIEDIIKANYSLQSINDYYKVYNFIYIILSVKINNSDIQFKYDNLKINNLLNKKQFKEYFRLYNYHYNKNILKTKSFRLKDLEIINLKIKNLNSEFLKILDFNNDIIYTFILNIYEYIICLYNNILQKYSNALFTQYEEKIVA